MPNEHARDSFVCVVGALAYDVIGRTDATLGTAQTLHNCKLSQLTEDFGGCGGNISYNLAHLGPPPLLVSPVGDLDFAAYEARLGEAGIDCAHLIRHANARCSRALIVTDAHGAQFTAFYPGPDLDPDELTQRITATAPHGARFTIAAPLPFELMRAALTASAATHPQACRVWCPGQYADSLTPEQADALWARADWIVGNAHEIGCLGPHLDVGDKTLIITHGPGPVLIRRGLDERRVNVPAVDDAADPTGCGDAFLAGLVAASLAGDEIDAAVTRGIDVAARCLRREGPQRHFG